MKKKASSHAQEVAKSRPTWRSRGMRVALAVLGGVAVLLGARLALPTYHAYRFTSAVRANDADVIKSLFKPSDLLLSLNQPPEAMQFTVLYPELNDTSHPRVESLSLGDVLWGRRRIKIQPHATLSAYPFYVTQWHVRDYDQLLL